MAAIMVQKILYTLEQTLFFSAVHSISSNEDPNHPTPPTILLYIYLCILFSPSFHFLSNPYSLLKPKLTRDKLGKTCWNLRGSHKMTLVSQQTLITIKCSKVMVQSVLLFMIIIIYYDDYIIKHSKL